MSARGYLPIILAGTLTGFMYICYGVVGPVCQLCTISIAKLSALNGGLRLFKIEPASFEPDYG